MNFNSLPSFFVIGAAKAGTTTLYDLLKQHPQAFLSFDKEPMFFTRDEHYSRGVEWYARTFFDGADKYTARGEATPHYLYWAEKAAPRIRKVYDSRPVKFLIILRNPIQRAYSWYWNMISDERETKPFFDAIQVEDKRIHDQWGEFERMGSMQYGYARGGRYASQVRYFFDEFPRESFHILLQEDLIKDPKTCMRDIFIFLGIDPEFEVEPGLSNPFAKPRIRSLHAVVRNSSRLKDFLKAILPYRLLYKVRTLILENNMKRFVYPEMEEQAYNYLREKFVHEVADLSGLIGRDLSHWDI